MVDNMDSNIHSYEGGNNMSTITFGKLEKVCDGCRGNLAEVFINFSDGEMLELCRNCTDVMITKLELKYGIK